MRRVKKWVDFKLTPEQIFAREQAKINEVINFTVLHLNKLGCVSKVKREFDCVRIRFEKIDREYNAQKTLTISWEFIKATPFDYLKDVICSRIDALLQKGECCEASKK